MSRHRLRLAHETLQEADVLLAASRWRGAANRLYYAAFYAARAYRRQRVPPEKGGKSRPPHANTKKAPRALSTESPRRAGRSALAAMAAVMSTYAVSGLFAIAVDEHRPTGRPEFER